MYVYCWAVFLMSQIDLKISCILTIQILMIQPILNNPQWNCPYYMYRSCAIWNHNAISKYWFSEYKDCIWIDQSTKYLRVTYIHVSILVGIFVWYLSCPSCTAKQESYHPWYNCIVSHTYFAWHVPIFLRYRCLNSSPLVPYLHVDELGHHWFR